MTSSTNLNEHVSVLADEVVAAFREQSRPVKKILEGTFGRGGHTRLLLRNFSEAKVVSFDRDHQAEEFAAKEFSEDIQKNHFQFVRDDFRNVTEHNLGLFDGAFFDLGVSSPQFDQAERGFSFSFDGPLDMRMDQNQEITAAEIVNTYSEEELADVFFHWGEVRRPRRVVRAIVHDRKTQPFTQTRELASLIERVERAGRDGSKGRRRIHPATGYFMGLRIAVNQELDGMAEFLEKLPESLEDGARIVVISFHSLEDRIVKTVFRKMNKITGHIINKKVIIPTEEEIEKNPRSRSAKMRIFQKGDLT
jgi:16S rRNA (cytosine1402-N4)-methyltransferase